MNGLLTYIESPT